MPIVKLQGGLGNQMFQYAYIRSLALRNSTDFLLDISEYETYFRKFELEIFDIEKRYAKRSQIPWFERIHIKNIYLSAIASRMKLFLKKFHTKYLLEKQFHFDVDFLTTQAEYIEGFFQSEKYFFDFKSQIRKDFTFIPTARDKNAEIIDLMQSCNAVSVHVRRGDYITNSGANSLLGTCTPEYYARAIENIESKLDNPTFFFFSDDIAWVKEQLKGEGTNYYIDWNSGDQSYEDMRLMSLCKHNIIANSSFSWWGAWLNENPSKMVIAPKRWFSNPEMNDSDIVPKDWIKM